MDLLPVEDPRGITVADLNKDGWPDLIYSNLSYDDVPIFWGSPEGYSQARRTQLVLPNMRSVTVNCADVNNDGWLDVLASCHTPAHRNSYVFLGSPMGFDVNRRIDLPTMAVQGSCLADFDRNGWLDVFLPSYSTGHINRTWTSFLYYNGEQGFSTVRRTGLLTDSGSGALALDFNRDGWLDLSVACHARPNGDHRANSFLFFGGPEGFSDYRRIKLPTEGSHDITHVDAGHIYHRRFEIAWTSGIHETTIPVEVTAINWSADTPHGSWLRFQLRLSADRDALDRAVWQGPNGPASFFDAPGHLAASPGTGRFMQYRAMFMSRDGSNYPLLREVVLELKPAGKQEKP